MRTTGSPVPAVSTLSDSPRASGTLNVSTVVELSASSRTANSHTGRCLHGNGGGRGGGEKPTRMHGDPLQGGGVTLQCDVFILPGVRALWLEDRRLAHHGNGRPS